MTTPEAIAEAGTPMTPRWAQPPHSGYGTPYPESEALLAVSVCDTDHARTVLRTMTGVERRSLADTVEQLGELIDEIEAACPACRSTERADRRMTGCGLPCDDPARWHAP